MDDSMIRRLGEFSHALLVTDEFKELNALFEQQVAVDVLQTKPKEPEERERLYAQLQGSRAFITLIEQFAQDHATLLAALDAPAPGQDDDDPAVHDISFEST